MTYEETLADARAQIVALRTTLTRREALLAKRREALTRMRDMIQQRADAPRAAREQTPLPHRSGSAADPVARPQRHGASHKMSRRGLLRGATASAAAATVGAIALGGAQPAHAAPETSGTGDVILGRSNTSGATTTFTYTTNTLPSPILQVNGSSYASDGIQAYGAKAIAGNANDSLFSHGAGVLGASTYGKSVSGSSTHGAGVMGTALGWGVNAVAGTGPDFTAGGTGRILQGLELQIGAPGAFTAGESIRDALSYLWLCVAVHNAPTDWARVMLRMPGAPVGGKISYLSKPIRLFDSRVKATDALFHPGVPCASSSPTTLQVSGDSFGGVTVPATVAGAIGNVTVLNEAAAGYLELVPSGAGFTGAANLAFAPGQIISNAFNVGLSNSGALDIIIGGGGSPATDVIVDLFAIVV